MHPLLVTIIIELYLFIWVLPAYVIIAYEELNTHGENMISDWPTYFIAFPLFTMILGPIMILLYWFVS